MMYPHTIAPASAIAHRSRSADSRAASGTPACIGSDAKRG